MLWLHFLLTHALTQQERSLERRLELREQQQVLCHAKTNWMQRSVERQLRRHVVAAEELVHGEVELEP